MVTIDREIYEKQDLSPTAKKYALACATDVPEQDIVVVHESAHGSLATAVGLTIEVHPVLPIGSIIQGERAEIRAASSGEVRPAMILLFSEPPLSKGANFGILKQIPEGWTSYTSLRDIIGERKLPEATSRRLEQLTRLPLNWDSENARPISWRTARRTAAMLERAYSFEIRQLPSPFIAPLPDGGLMVEWKTASGKELILEVSPAEEPTKFLLVEPVGSGQEIEVEGKLGEDYSLNELIRRLQD